MTSPDMCVEVVAGNKHVVVGPRASSFPDKVVENGVRSKTINVAPGAMPLTGRSNQQRRDRLSYGALSMRLWEQRGRVGFPRHVFRRKQKPPCRLRNTDPWPSLFPAHCRFVLGNRRGRLKGTGRTSNLRPQPDVSGVRRIRDAPGLS